MFDSAPSTDELTRQNEELARTRDRLLGLAWAAAEAQSAPSEDGILAAICSGAVRAGLSAHAALRDPADSATGGLQLRIRAVALRDASAPLVDKIVGRPILGAPVDAAAVPSMRTALQRGRAVLVHDTRRWITRALPWLSESAADRMARLPDVAEAICAPITDGHQNTGVLVVWGRSLGDFDCHTIALLGRLAGTALLALRRQASERDRLRLEGALLLARTAAHELNNSLSVPVGYADLLTGHPAVQRDPQLRLQVERIRDSAQDAAERLARLQHIVRLAEKPSGAGNPVSVIDIDRSIVASG